MPDEGERILMNFPLKYGIYKYAPLALAMDYCRAGWMPIPALEGTHHGTHAVLMAWLCTCSLPVPR